MYKHQAGLIVREKINNTTGECNLDLSFYGIFHLFLRDGLFNENRVYLRGTNSAYPSPLQSADVPSLEEKVRKMIDEDLVVSTSDAFPVDKGVIVFPCVLVAITQ